MRSGGVGVVERFGAPPLGRVDGRRDLHVGESGPEIEARASRDYRHAVIPDEPVDALVGQCRVLADGHRVAELTDRDERPSARRAGS